MVRDWTRGERTNARQGRRPPVGGIVLLVFALVAPARAHEAALAPVLRVGTSGDYAPFSFRTADGQLTGFDVRVVERLAADLGRRVELVGFQWPDLLEQLEAGAFDVAMSGVTVRPERAVWVNFTRPYARTGAVAVIRSRDHARFRTLATLDRPAVRIAVNRGGHLEQVARTKFPHAHVVAIANNTALPDLLRRGRAAAVISEELEARTWPGQDLATLGPFTHDRKAYAVRRGTGDLLRQVDDWLAAREADGWLNTQRQRWLGEQATLTPPQATFEALGGAIALRLQLMPAVAAVKRREHLPIEDPAQEARVIERVRAAARSAGLNPEDVAELFHVQMAVAKAVEQHAAQGAAPPNASLADLRAAVATVSDQVIVELARCQPWLQDATYRRDLAHTVRDSLTMPGLSPALVTQLVDALLGVHPAGAG
jgi:cyclohexadienyl dehydratase